MYAIVDQAIRKEISWHEARARLHELVMQEPDLFAVVDYPARRHLREYDSEDQADDQADVPGTNNGS